ncbi:formyltetrahydrofolate deformylase [Baekduia soli]|uniref:Formyltetrahydrofolate deformylase n=1 Tax=Baekduia soli TaxID=496014 RepID=A0A5B8UDD2_9ACTN|nr:formyltetrahydrofolate deformylase [Baekduia soli]
MTRLLISCRDRPGIVAAVSQFLHRVGANIVSSDQHSTDAAGGGPFFMRMEFALPAAVDLEPVARAFGSEVAENLAMDWTMWPAERPKRLALLASRHDHCLLDLLWRERRGELEARTELVVSNHPDLEADVDRFGVPYHHVPVVREHKAEAEQRLLELLAGRVDLVVLARYMQILTGGFLERVGVPVINIHHSFLPAFAGADPHQRAKDRGVKLIGATAHYVTEELDAGPIIEQDVIRVDHRHSAARLARLGSDIERVVLARAVAWHCEDRVLRYGATTVVFA